MLAMLCMVVVVVVVPLVMLVGMRVACPANPSTHACGGCRSVMMSRGLRLLTLLDEDPPVPASGG